MSHILILINCITTVYLYKLFEFYIWLHTLHWTPGWQAWSQVPKNLLTAANEPAKQLRRHAVSWNIELLLPTLRSLNARCKRQLVKPTGSSKALWSENIWKVGWVLFCCVSDLQLKWCWYHLSCQGNWWEALQWSLSRLDSLAKGAKLGLDSMEPHIKHTNVEQNDGRQSSTKCQYHSIILDIHTFHTYFWHTQSM